MPTFASVLDLEAYTQKDLTEPASMFDTAELALEMATGLIQSYTRQTFFSTTDDVVVLMPKGTTVILPGVPIVSVTSVVQGGEALTYELWPAGVLRLTGASFDPVTVTYSHGYAEIPQDVRMVCLSSAARSMENPTMMHRESTGSYNGSYAQSGFNLGAGAYLTDAEKAALSRYRMGALA